MYHDQNYDRRRKGSGRGRFRSGYTGQGRGNYQPQEEEATTSRPSRGRGERRGRRGPILGYKRLENLQSLTADEVVNNLLHCKDSFIDLIASEEMKDDWIYLLIHVLANVCESLMKQNANQLLSLLKDSNFLSKILKEYILGLQFEADEFSEDDLERLLQSLTTFFKEWVKRFPGSSQKLPLDEFCGCLSKLKCDVSEVQKEVDDLLEIRDEELRNRTQQKKLKKCLMKGSGTSASPVEVEGTPPDDFHNLSVEPKSEEISSREPPFLRRNRTGEDEKYDDLNHYLDVQFRLLREDFVGPLREGIREIKSGVSKEERSYDLSLYEDVKILGLGFTTSGVIRKIRFRSFVKRKEFWQHSKRLLYGSFLCLSRDNFKTMTFATVADRKPEDLANGFVHVRFIDGIEQPVKNNDKFVLVESPAYFESYRHVLQRLKEITLDNFPFQEYLVNCSPDVQRPAYLTDGKTRYDLTEALSTAQGVNANVEVLNQRDWPGEDVVELNGSQYEAMKAALTKEFVVIQGPPGTGKTYVGLKIVRALMDNRAVWNPDPERSSCMLMVCYTNHALDQFLEGILEFQTDGVVRVGGRSKSDVLQNHNLNELTRLSEGQRRVYKETKESQEYLEKCVKALEESRNRILTLEELKDSIGLCHRKQLTLMSYEFKQKGLSPVEGWLGLDKLVPIPPQEQRKEMEYPIEEVIEENNIDVDYDADIIESQRQIGDDVRGRAQARDWENKGKVQTKPRYAALSKQQLEILKGNKIQPMAQKDALSIFNIQSLDKAQRWSLYLFWLRLFRSNKQEEIKAKSEEFEQQCKRLAEVKSFEELKVLSQATVIGMTTTGAAKYSKLLEEIKPRIVVVEEAAEVLEAHIITSLTQETQHLILIGDHKQLRPNPTCYNLSQAYNLDVSLFERMVKGGMRCESLDIQHRMRPEISRVLKHIYQKLDDHPKVHEYKNVPGVSYNMYFINHNVKEDNNEYDQKLKSYSNKHEASYMVALCEYFLNQGYRPEEITLLTMYTGQLLVLRKLMPKERFQGVRVTAVDNFQGEENKIILLSLVRSNDKRKIGFLGTENRVCVALSRAQEGFFCIGNFTMLAEKSELWKKIVEDMKAWDAIGSALELVCKNHPENKIWAKTAGDFSDVPEGGCLQPCAYRLDCGHSCERVCHPVDSEHKQYKCRKYCQQELCSEHGTRCKSKCHYGTPCKGCEVGVLKVIPVCGHEVSVPCGVSSETFQCQEQCRTRFGCRHLCPKKCFEKCDPSDCKVQISKELGCGHVATGGCSEIRDSSYKCQEPCNTILECGHPCGGTCSSCKQGRLHVTCKDPCQRILVCQHRCAEPCSKSCPPCSQKCENRCVHSRCPLSCQEPCTPCKEMCSWECQRSCRNRYKCKGLCSEKCTRPRCDTPCFKMLPCQHRCIGLCGEPCPKLCIVCNKEELTALYFGGEDEKGARFIELLDCGHVFEVQGMDNWMSVDGDDEEEDQSIQLKCCPKCTTPIRRSFRYADIVKEKQKNIEKVKKKVMGEERKLEGTKDKLLDFIEKLGNLYPEIGIPARSGYDDSEGSDEFDLEEREEGEEQEEGREERLEDDSILKTFEGWLRQRRTMTELTTIQNQLLLLKAICNLRRTARNSGPFLSQEDFEMEEIIEDLDNLQTKVVSTFHISQQQLKDVRDEVTRVALKLKLRHLKRKITKAMTSVNDMDRQTLEQVERKLTNGRRLREKDARDMVEVLTDIGARNGVSSLTREKWSMVPRIGFTTGHWYKCPKGHITPVDQSRGSDQEIKCSECTTVAATEWWM